MTTDTLQQTWAEWVRSHGMGWMPPITLLGYRVYAPAEVEVLMRDYAIAAIEAYRKSLKPVAWGVPNSRTPERQPFLSLLHQLPQDGGVDGRRKTPLYPAMLVPLYRLDDQP